METKFIRTIIATVFLAALIFSCANQLAPSGGPEDKDPPEAVSASIEHGQVNVDLRSRVNVVFSEWINLASARRAVAVYPRLPQGVTVKAAKNRITVIPNEPLKENTTYHIVIGTSLQDLRGNAVKHPINIVFSTGAALDSGSVEGAVVPLGQLAALPRIGLYWEDDEWTDARYFAAPDYMAHSDSSGAFAFSHLREGTYRVAAFVDQYRVGRLHMGDTCFTSLEKSITVTMEPQKIRLFPALSDTVTAAVDTADIDTAGFDDEALAADTSGIDKPDIDTLRVDAAELIDTADVVDTLKTDMSDIDTLNADASKADTAKSDARNVCPLLSGRAACLEPDARRKWMYRPRSGTEAFVVPDSAGTFTFVDLPASMGTLLWFIDDNDDDEITLGRLVPWRPPEQFFIVPGVIEAKARWEVVDLEVEGCLDD